MVVKARMPRTACGQTDHYMAEGVRSGAGHEGAAQARGMRQEQQELPAHAPGPAPTWKVMADVPAGPRLEQPGVLAAPVRANFPWSALPQGPSVSSPTDDAVHVNLHRQHFAAVRADLFVLRVWARHGVSISGRGQAGSHRLRSPWRPAGGQARRPQHQPRNATAWPSRRRRPAECGILHELSARHRPAPAEPKHLVSFSIAVLLRAVHQAEPRRAGPDEPRSRVPEQAGDDHGSPTSFCTELSRSPAVCCPCRRPCARQLPQHHSCQSFRHPYAAARQAPTRPRPCPREPPPPTPCPFRSRQTSRMRSSARSRTMTAPAAARGEAIPLHAGAHPPRPPRALHLEAARHRGKLSAHDKHPSLGAPSAACRSATLGSRLGNQNDLYSQYNQSIHSPTASRSPVDFRRPSQLPTANAAAALAALSNSRPSDTWENNHSSFSDQDQALHNYFAHPDAQNIFNDPDNHLGGTQITKEALQNLMAGNNRAASLQPFQRKPNRPRKASITESARKPKHERQRSKDQKRISSDRKAFSAEPGAALLASKRWEDLLDAAASATEEDSHELTPIPQSPRGSVPPFTTGQNHNAYQSYTTSPLQNTVLPHSPDEDETYAPPPPLEAFPSVESTFDTSTQPTFHHQQSSGDSSVSHAYGGFGHHAAHSGSNFHIAPEGLNSSPTDTAVALTHMRSYSGSQNYRPHTGHSQQAPTPLVQHYCAACHRVTPLNSSYACTECICGICRDCVDVLTGMGPERGARCPRCGTIGCRFKPFMLDLR
ncbi:hypothetical protein FH972_025494 [Carpinus fangiana]|uniref:RING zinc finger-like domain-containing protein n=1 Tax=Carpinus fangiana TaxID=176857 RepID=A0A5N6L1L3_9ROSI|nr:hypothetical protein FH972_025494 [Carpinus fangiana]